MPSQPIRLDAAPRRVSFVHLPYCREDARLETMPFALNILRRLDQENHDVHLILAESKAAACPAYRGKSIFIHDVSTALSDLEENVRRPSRFNRVREWLFMRRLHSLGKMEAVFSVGQLGAWFASRIARHSACPFAYLSDEFPSNWRPSLWAVREKEAASEARAMIVPDLCRAPQLRKDLSLPESTAFVEVPNAPASVAAPGKVNWRAKLELPDNSTIVLHAGSIADWAQVPELLSIAPWLPDNAVVVVHGRSHLSHANQWSHLHMPGRTLFTSGPVPEGELHDLIAQATVCIALYRNTGPNIEYIGKSAGKLVRAISLGCPVIASRLPSLDFIETNRLGLLVNHPSEIPNAVARIVSNRAAYSERCFEYSANQLSFDTAWKKLEIAVGFAR